MATRFIIRFNIAGNGATPETIGMGDLGELLRHLDEAIKAAVPPELRIEHASQHAPLVSLVSVKEGNSSDMGMAVLDYGVPALSDLTEAIATGLHSRMPVNSQENLSFISKWVIKKGYVFEFEGDAALKVRHAVISREHPVASPYSSDAVADGVTNVWGFLLRAGGREPRSTLLFPNGEKLAVTGDELVTKQLAQRLYEDVGIEGIATWRSSDWKMVAFKAQRVLEYRPQDADVVQAFTDLAEASGGRWDDVDAAAYVRDLRGETGR